MQSYTLYELNEHIRRVIALNFSDPVWIRAEIAQLASNRGHHYLSLVQKNEATDDIIAESEAIIWQSNYRRIKKQIGADLVHLLKEGTEILFRATPGFHERFGFKLIIEAIDPAHTLGQLELRRRQILAELEAQNLLTKNKRHQLPLALQQIAVLSSPKAAGYQDFIQQLKGNSYGYFFKPELFPIAVQGEKVEQEMLNALKEIEQSHKSFDTICLIRGGGSKLDLTAFDSLPLAKAIAELSLPFLSGIGHDINQTVVDQVAHTALKTPTALADFLINHNLHFEVSLNQMALQLKQLQDYYLQRETIKLTALENDLEWHCRQLLLQEEQRMKYWKEEIPKLSGFLLRSHNQKISALEQVHQLLSAEATLKRGYSITFKDGKAIRSVKDVKKGDKIISRLKDGEFESEVD